MILGLVSVSDAVVGLETAVLQPLMLATALLLLLPLFRRLLQRQRNVLALLAYLFACSAAVMPTMTRDGALPSTDYLMRLAVFGTVFMLLGLSLVEAVVRDAVLIGLVMASCIVAALKLFGFIEAAGHIEAGRAIGIGLPLAPILLRTPQHPRRRATWTFAAVVVLLVAGTLLTGARGPLVFGMLVLVVEMIAMSNVGSLKRPTRVLILFALTSAMTVGVPYALSSDIFGNAGATALTRQSEVLSSRSFDDFASGRARLKDVYSPAIGQIRDHFPGGVGLPADAEPGGEYDYSHNVYLELVLGLGVLGLIAGALLGFATLINVVRYRRVEVCVSGLVVFLMLNAQLSGDLAINRQLALIIGLTVAARPTRIALSNSTLRRGASCEPQFVRSDRWPS